MIDDDFVKPQPLQQQQLGQSPFYKNQTQNKLCQSQYNSLVNLSYFQLLKVMLKENRLFFCHQFMSGNFIKNVFEYLQLGCLFPKNNKPDLIEAVLLGIYRVITPNWLANCLRPFLCGLFFPMIVLFYLNYQYVQNAFDVSQNLLNIVEMLMIVNVIIFLILGISTGGNLNNDIWEYQSTNICEIKPWIKTEKIYCINCKIIKPIRSYHCSYCNHCTPKYTKHSIVLNQCIGASNQLLYMAFQGIFFILITVLLALLISPKQSIFTSFKVFIIRFIFFFVNSYIQGMSGFEFLRGLLYTINYNCTQHEVNTWSLKIYLCTFDRKRFYNPFQTSVLKHFASSVYGFLGCLDEQGENRTINWAKTYFYYPSHIPKHHEKTQWSLYFQQQEQKQSKRFKLLERQKQILQQIQFIKPSKVNVTSQQKLRDSYVQRQKMQPQLNNLKQLKQQGSKCSSEVLSISATDSKQGNNGQQFLNQTKVNKTSM